MLSNRTDQQNFVDFLVAHIAKFSIHNKTIKIIYNYPTWCHFTLMIAIMFNDI